jgi:hypothetical protein
LRHLIVRVLALQSFFLLCSLLCVSLRRLIACLGALQNRLRETEDALRAAQVGCRLDSGLILASVRPALRLVAALALVGGSELWVSLCTLHCCWVPSCPVSNRSCCTLARSAVPLLTIDALLIGWLQAEAEIARDRLDAAKAGGEGFAVAKDEAVRFDLCVLLQFVCDVDAMEPGARSVSIGLHSAVSFKPMLIAGWLRLQWL